MDHSSVYADLQDTAIHASENQVVSSQISSRCMERFSKYFQIPEVVLKTFITTEGGYPGHIRSNTDGSFDVGPMQINSIHWPELYEKFNISPIDIRFNGCMNLMVGARFIRSKIDEYGTENITDWNSLFTKLANYHSKTEKYNSKYKEKWVENFNMILEGER